MYSSRSAYIYIYNITHICSYKRWDQQLSHDEHWRFKLGLSLSSFSPWYWIPRFYQIPSKRTRFPKSIILALRSQISTIFAKALSYWKHVTWTSAKPIEHPWIYPGKFKTGSSLNCFLDLVFETWSSLNSFLVCLKNLVQFELFPGSFLCRIGPILPVSCKIWILHPIWFCPWPFLEKYELKNVSNWFQIETHHIAP